MFVFQELNQIWLELNQLHNRSIVLGQDQVFDQLMQYKQTRMLDLKKNSTLSKKITVYVSNRLHNCVPEDSVNIKWVKIDIAKYLAMQITVDVESEINILLFTGGDIHTIELFEAINKFKTNNQDVILAAWDTDNHHALHVSMFTAYISDYYFPSHVENLYILSRFNSNIQHMKSACVAFPIEMILNNFKNIVFSERVNQVWGRHANYNLFPYRNRVINSMSRYYNDVCHVETNIGNEDIGVFFNNFMKHKVHFVAPTLNDVSGRVYEIYATGGIPILPESLKVTYNGLAEINDDDIQFYEINDLFLPDKIVQKALRKFDKSGRSGIYRRVELGLQNHGSLRSKNIINFVVGRLDKNSFIEGE